MKSLCYKCRKVDEVIDMINIVDKLFNMLRIAVAKYDDKRDPGRKDIFMCNSVDTRNRYKKEKSKYIIRRNI